MSLHFTRAFCLIYLIGVCIAIATSGCSESKSKSKSFEVDQQTLYHNDGDRVLSISGVALQPLVTRDLGCGEENIHVDEAFKLYLQKSFNRSAPADRWFIINPLQSVVWNWDEKHIELTLTEEFIENTLVRGPFSMKIITPLGDEYIKEQAFTVVKREKPKTETDAPTDTDTCIPEALCDSSTSSEDTGSESGSTAGYETGQPNEFIDTSTSSEPAVNRATFAWRLDRAMMIDGELSIDWPTSDGSMLPNQLRRVVFEDTANDGEVTDNNLCSFDVVWGNALYIAVRCDDDSKTDPASLTSTPLPLIQGDSVEIYIDASNLNPDNPLFSYTILRIAYEKSGATFYTPYWESSPQIEAKIAMVDNGRTRDGFTMEIEIPWHSLTVDMPRAGMSMGFDVAVNDRDSGDEREFQLMWSGSTNNHFNNSDFGTLTFSQLAPPDFSFSQTGDAGNNGCEKPRMVTWDNAKTAENPIKVVNWNFSQTASINSCATGDADSWFTVNMPAHSTVYFDLLNNRDFEVDIARSTTTDCSEQDCQIILPESGLRSIQNNESDTANATVVISNKDMYTDDISYINFRAVKNSN